MSKNVVVSFCSVTY